jgi:hypothetical protein
LRADEAPLHLRPLEALEERVDVVLGGRAVVDRIRVLVHVHHQQRRAERHRIGVVAGPIDARAVGVEGPIEDRPPAAATERIAERAEQFLPARVRTVRLHQHSFGLRARRLAVAAEIPEVQLVQDHIDLAGTASSTRRVASGDGERRRPARP